MENIKIKAKIFWEDNKDTIIKTGKAVAAGILVGVAGGMLYNAGYKYGAGMGFNGALDWLDEEFPDKFNAKQVFETWMTENPDKVSNVNCLGIVRPGKG